MDSFDGQERLLALVVGMDAAKREWPQARSRIYRAISRAHLQVIAINEVVRGGLLEWITKLKLKQGAGFDGDVERKERDPSAAGAALEEAEEQMLDWDVFHLLGPSPKADEPN